MSNSSNSSPEGEFNFGTLLRWLQEGCESNDEIPGREIFEARIRIFIHKHDFKVFHGKYDLEDFRQDIYVRLLELAHKLKIPDNILTEDDFFRWLFVVVNNHYYSMLRRHAAQKRDRLRSDKPLEEVHIPAYAVDFEASMFFSRFSKFVETYPEKWRRATFLWLDGSSYRDVAEILNGEGVQCTHAAVRNWVMAIIGAFRKTLELPPPQRLRKQARPRLVS